MHPHTFLYQFYPWLKTLFNGLFVVVSPITLARPTGFRQAVGIFKYPWRLVVRNKVREIASTALREIEVNEFRKAIPPPPLPSAITRRFRFTALMVFNAASATRL